MKQELVRLAKDKGFVATFVYDKPFIYSSKEPLRWLFWMTELQKWLRDNYNCIVEINYSNCEWWQWIISYDNINIFGTNETDDINLTYAQILEIGLFEALKLIEV